MTDPAKPFATATAADARRPSLQPDLHIADDGQGALAVPCAEPHTGMVVEEMIPLDVHGFDPTAYEWIPVPRRARHDGWTEARQREFVEALADTGSVTAAANAVGMSVNACYALRRAPGAEQLAAAWDAAIHAGVRRLADVALERALNGVEEPVFDREGHRVGCRYRYSDRMIMFLLGAHMPERYGHGARTPEMPVARAIAQLSPAPPAEPHRLLSPDALISRVQDAIDLGESDFVVPKDANGTLHRKRPVMDEDPAPEGSEAHRRLAWLMIGVKKIPSTGYPPAPHAPPEEEEDWYPE